jgi:predicted RNase H-like nuclease (RuvC/YqgF family)
MTNMHVGRTGLAVLAMALAAAVSGCDYWPPALQTQIEQLRSEVQTATAEKTKLESQVATLTSEKNAAHAKVDELNRLLKTRTDQVASLEQSLATERERVAKLSAKPAAKAAKKKTATTKKR